MKHMYIRRQDHDAIPSLREAWDSLSPAPLRVLPGVRFFSLQDRERLSRPGSDRCFGRVRLFGGSAGGGEGGEGAPRTRGQGPPEVRARCAFMYRSADVCVYVYRCVASV